MVEKPECYYGYTEAQLERIITDKVHFNHWMRGQTGAICEGTNCKISHGFVTYYWDVERYLER